MTEDMAPWNITPVTFPQLVFFFFLAARAKQAEKLFSLFLVCGEAAVLARPRRRACKDDSHTAVRLRILCMALAFSFLFSAGSCAGRNTPRNSAFRSFLSGPASATRTCLALVPSRLWWYNIPGSRVSNMAHSFVVAPRPTTVLPPRGAVETGPNRFVPVAAAALRGGALRGVPLLLVV